MLDVLGRPLDAPCNGATVRSVLYNALHDISAAGLKNAVFVGALAFWSVFWSIWCLRATHCAGIVACMLLS
jgi:hypothetical protein